MITFFLATVIGWYLVIFSLLMLLRWEYIKPVMKEIMNNRGVFFITAVITLIMGLLLVTSHNLWIMGWPVIITLFSWLVLLGGLFRLFFIDTALDWGKSFVNEPLKVKITGGVLLIIGLFLLYHVYFFYM